MRRRLSRSGIALVVALALSSACGREPAPAPRDPLVVDDVSRLHATHVSQVRHPDRLEDLVDALAHARELGLPVSIGARRHSQGGHIVTNGAVYLDMMGYDRVLDVDPEARTITVQAGATWGDVQEALQPHGLAVAVMQSSNIFTVGGSLSCNAHGRDPRFGPIVGTVRSFRLLRADGSLVHVDRERHADLFSLVIGGYGLLGVIVDVTLDVVPDVMLQRRVIATDAASYPALFAAVIRDDPDVQLTSARLSIAPGHGFLRDMYSVAFRRIAGDPGREALRHEDHLGRNRFFFGLSRRHGWGRGLRWFLQAHWVDRPGQRGKTSRNNAMRPDIDFIRHESETDTDILQEYFVPVDRFATFVEEARTILVTYDVRLLHATVRFLRPDTETFVPYATEDMFAVVLLMNIDRDEAGVAGAQHWTRQLVDAAARHGGRYYLTYQGFPSRAQSRAAYPTLDEFFARKREADPGLLFRSRFWEEYGVAEEVPAVR